jgi:hypothetical protein
MRIPHVRFTIRSMMLLVVLLGIVFGAAVSIQRLKLDQNDDGFINDPMHPRWRRPSTPSPTRTPTGPDTHPPIFLAGGAGWSRSGT